MSGWYRRLQRADETKKRDRAFVLPSVRRDGLALELAHESLRGDAEVVSAAVEQDGLAIRFASRDLQNQKDLVLAAVRGRGGPALAHASAALRRDREVVLAAVERDGSALRHACSALRGDIGVVLAAVTQDGSALEHARSALRADRQVVLSAVQSNGRALEFACEELRRDVDVCAVACRNDPSAVHFTDDPEVRRQAHLSALRHVREQLRLEAEEARRKDAEQHKALVELSEQLLKEQSRRREGKKDRGSDRRKELVLQSEALAAVAASWAEKVAIGGRVYRMIEGWREGNMSKIIERGTLDLGDPWERHVETSRPPPPRAPVQKARTTPQPAAASATKTEVYSGPDFEIVRQHLLGTVQKMTGADDFDMDTPLMESGIDSLASVDLRQQLQQDFKINLPSTLMFNYPTLGGLSTYMVDELTAHKVPGWGSVLIEQTVQEAPTVEQHPVQVEVEAQPEAQAPDPEEVRLRVLHRVHSMTGEGDLDMDTPLMETGLDSIASVDLRLALQQEFQLNLPSTLMFNYPTVSGIVAFLIDQLAVQA